MSNSQLGLSSSLSSLDPRAHKGLFVGIILFVALIAFEIFNFDTTKFALQNLLGDVTFLGFHWAAILAVAFCAIDFAGLNRLFSSADGKESKEAWYLMGAWLLGATMNAVMTWWAVSVTLLNNNFGNEVLSREQLLRYVPIFVAILVWLTRILFIGSLSIAGEHLFNSKKSSGKRRRSNPTNTNRSSSNRRRQPAPSRAKAAPKPSSSMNMQAQEPSKATPVLTPTPINSTNRSPQSRSSRLRQRPPVPNSRINRSNSRIQASQRR